MTERAGRAVRSRPAAVRGGGVELGERDGRRTRAPSSAKARARPKRQASRAAASGSPAGRRPDRGAGARAARRHGAASSASCPLGSAATARLDRVEDQRRAVIARREQRGRAVDAQSASAAASAAFAASASVSLRTTARPSAVRVQAEDRRQRAARHDPRAREPEPALPLCHQPGQPARKAIARSPSSPRRAATSASSTPRAASAARSITARVYEAGGPGAPVVADLLPCRYVAGWSSLVARRAHNPKVAGSNPAPAIEKAL